jgi:hypothetical protein
MRPFWVYCFRLLVAVIILLLIAIRLLPQGVISRDRQMEFGVSLGAVAYLGDIQGNKGKGTPFLKDLNIKNTRSIQGIFFTYYPNFDKSRVGFKAVFNNGTIHGADSLIKPMGGDEMDRIRRNLSFKTSFNELLLTCELYFLRGRFRPNITLGLGAIQFDPRAQYKGEWIRLQPLQTEGREYGLIEPLAMVGGGFKYFTGTNKVISLEVLYRQTATDYLDDVSTVYTGRFMSFRERVYRDHVGEQRGDEKDKDVYFSVVLKYSVLLKQNVKFLRRQSLLCPRDVY